MDFRQEKLSGMAVERYNRNGKLVSTRYTDFADWTIAFERNGTVKVYEMRRDVPKSEWGLRLGKRIA